MLQLIGADSGEAVSDSEAYLELVHNIKNWIQIYLTTAGKGLITFPKTIGFFYNFLLIEDSVRYLLKKYQRNLI